MAELSQVELKGNKMAASLKISKKLPQHDWNIVNPIKANDFYLSGNLSSITMVNLDGNNSPTAHI